MMTSSKGLIYLAVLALLASVCHTATGSNANDGDVTALAISVDTNGDDTASIPDFDGDGTIGFGDFVIFAGVFGARQGDEKYESTYDLNGDGEIGFSDFVVFAQNFGKDAPSPVVKIPDANLRPAIETALGKDSGAPITRAEMATMDSLEASDADIDDLTGLESAVNLTWLDLASNDITNVSVLEGLTNLTHLILSGNNITDLASLVANTGLGAGDTVDLSDNPLNVTSQSTHIPALQERGVSISFVAPAVTIPDANLRAAIELALGKASRTPITQAEMKTLTKLFVFDVDISDLTGLEFATNLYFLRCEGTRGITNLSALSGLTNLTNLDLAGNNITEILALSGLTKLRYLRLTFNNIKDISLLSSLTNLTSLGLSGNTITDVSALSGLTNLTELTLWNNNITDVSALSGLTNLSTLDLSGNNITDVSALSSLTNLTWLSLSNNNITDISLLSSLTNLTSLQLSDNNITDISLLSSLTNLTSLQLSDNNITDISLLSSLTNLTSLGLSGNTITDVSTLASLLSGLTNLTKLFLGSTGFADISLLSGLTSLTWLDLSGNNITDVSALSGLTNLTLLWLENNNITDVSPLSGLTNLSELWLQRNPLNNASINVHIPALKSSGALVRFDQLRKGDFDIELVFLDPFTEDQKNVLQYVARRWMSVITGDLPDYEFAEGWSGMCGEQSYEIPAGERIDDLRILVTSFDRGVPGWGSPRLLREESHLPVLGCMAFDLKRANLLITGLHEIGHVLGFGPVWDDLGFYQNPPDGDQHFNGPLAIAAFDDAGGRNYTGAKVPLNDSAHWRVPVLSGELMGRSGGAALSAITVQSMADLGYGVDVAQADAYTLPSAAAGKAVARVATSRPSVSVPGVDLTRATISPSRDADLYGQGKMADGRSFIFPDRRWTGRQESAEWVWGRGIESDVTDGRKLWSAGPPAYAEPELTCGAGLMNEPIYVIDPQGHIVRTIRQ